MHCWYLLRSEKMCVCVCTCLPCRLGETLLSEGLDITSVPRFGVGSGPILLDDVSCTGKEPSLLLCNRKEWLRHDCTHHEDVNIACSADRNGDSLPTSKTESYLAVRLQKDADSIETINGRERLNVTCKMLVMYVVRY